MNFKQLVTIFLALIFSATAVLAADKLKIGVTKKIAPEDCLRKTRHGDVIQMHYEGRLDDGTVFDSSYSRNQPLEFTLGVGQVIQGWDMGLTKMCIGEKRKLTIPSDLAYGDRGVGPIPPKATLIFETELVGIKGYTAPEIVNDEL